MTSTNTAMTRMRKAFRYPTDDDEDTAPTEGVDEEEQEKLIKELIRADAFQTAFYKRIFLAIPLLALLHFLYTTSTSTPDQDKDKGDSTLLTTLLRLTSLLLSLATASSIPIPNTTSTSTSTSSSTSSKPNSQLPFPPPHPNNNTRSPKPCWHRRLLLLRDNIIWINAAICALLVFKALVSRAGLRSWSWWGVLEEVAREVLVCGVVAVARRELRAVDVVGLEGLRYEFKGA